MNESRRQVQKLPGSARGFDAAFKKFCARKGLNPAEGRRQGGKGFKQ